MNPQERPHQISVVIPVYQGEKTLASLMTELEPYQRGFTTPGGHVAEVSEVLLVHDCGPDASDRIIRELAATHDWIRPVWLSRNFGQHPATLAGMASSGGDWVATLDEDGQQDPADLPGMLDEAMTSNCDVVYGRPLNEAPHGVVRNTASKLAKRSLRWVSGSRDAAKFNSYRFVLGEVARSVAAYSGSGAYLDVALGWVARGVTTAPVTLRDEGERVSGYRLRSLMSHYWRMVLTGGTRLLRVVSITGALLALAGFVFALVIVGQRVFGVVPVAGWASAMVVTLIGVGMMLFALGVVAEYVGVLVMNSMGKPLYLITGDRDSGPHGRIPSPGE